MTKAKGAGAAKRPPVFPSAASPPIRCTSLFDLADVESLRKGAGFDRLAKVAVREVVCEILNIGAEDAIGLAMWDAEPCVPSQRRDFHARVAGQCRGLLAALGASESLERLWSEPADLPAVSELLAILSTINSLRAQGGIHSTMAAVGMFADVGNNPRKTSNGGARIDLAAFEKAVAAIYTLPRTLALLVEIADAGESYWGAGKGVAGRSPNRAHDALFAGLAGAYFEAFGEPPNDGPDRYNPKEPSLRWAIGAIHIAHTRAGRRIRLDSPGESGADVRSHPAVLTLADAKALAPATKADRMVAGWKAWQERKPDPRVEMHRPRPHLHP
jgi:hypothetical protein